MLQSGSCLCLLLFGCCPFARHRYIVSFRRLVVTSGGPALSWAGAAGVPAGSFRPVPPFRCPMLFRDLYPLLLELDSHTSSVLSVVGLSTFHLEGGGWGNQPHITLCNIIPFTIVMRVYDVTPRAILPQSGPGGGFQVPAIVKAVRIN